MSKLYLAVLTAVLFAVQARAANDCVFATNGTTMTLQGDCTTDASLLPPDGFTYDGNRNVVTAVDPAGDHFRGAVIQKYGGSANVVNFVINAGSLANVCDAGADRLRGILFDNASGAILNNTVLALNQGASGCQEGNAIEARNIATVTVQQVEIAQNDLRAWQKSGIVVNGAVNGHVHHNRVTPSATQSNLAANSLQYGFGSSGLAEHNDLGLNSWLGWSPASDYAATGILVYDTAPGAVVVQRNNLMSGNADAGIYIFADGVTVDNNRVFESGPDAGYDIGIGDDGVGNTVTNNKVTGFETPYDGPSTDKGKGANKVVPDKD